MKKVKLTILSILLVFVTVFTLVGCDRLFDESTEPTPPGASQVNITRETAEVGVGKAIQLVAQKQNNTDPTVWFSSDDRIATVSATGRVEGKYPGVVTITAMAGSASDTCTVTVTGEVPEGSVEYNKQVTGNGTITVAGGYELGDTAIVTFTPNACYELIEDSVKVNGVAMTPVNGTLSFEAMETNYVIEAAFRGQILSVKTTCDTALGNVVVEDKEYRYGDEIVVKATAVENYRVYGAIVNGKTVATDGAFTIKTTDYVATNFDVEVLIKGVDVKVNKNAENGTIEVDGETIYNGEVTFNFVPANGYKFVSATVNGEVVTTSSYTTTLTSMVYEVTATYEIKEVTVSMNMYLDGVAMQEPLVKEYKWFDEVELTEMDFDKFPVFFKLVDFTINGKDASGMVGEDGLVRFTAENDNYDVKVYVTYADVTIKTNAENATVKFDKDAYKFGDEVTFTVTPNEGYNVIKVGVVDRDLTVDGNTYTFTATNYGNPLSYEILVATEIKESILTATMIIDGEKQTMSAPVEWFTEQELMFAAPSEELQLIVATINGESVIDKIDEEGYYSFTVKADAYDIVAEYVTKTSAVTATGDAHAVVTLNADAYKWGDKVTVSVAVATGYEIKSATVNGESFEFTDGEYTFKAWADKYEIVVTTINSNVAYSEEITGNGTVNATGSFIYNEKVTFEFIADEGYEFVSATVNGVEVTESTYVYTVDSLEIEVTATFVLKNAVVNPIVVFDGVEIVSPELPKVPWFKELNLSFYGENSGIPEQYKFEYATLNGVDITSEIVDGRYTFVVKADAYEIKAYYVTKSVSVNTIANNATVTFEKGAYKWGDTVNFEVTANEGYNVTEVTVNGEVVTDYTFTANGETFEIEVTTELKDVTGTIEMYLDGEFANKQSGVVGKWFEYTDMPINGVPVPDGYELADIKVNGESVIDKFVDGYYRIEYRSDEIVISIYAVKKTVTVTYTAPGATVTFEKGAYKWGDIVNFEVTANEGYKVTEVTVNGEVVTNYTFTANGETFEIEVKVEIVYLVEYATLNKDTVSNYKAFDNAATYIDATAIANDKNLPALPVGVNAYAKLTTTANAYGVVEFRVKPTVTYEQFVSADYIEFDYFAPGEGDRVIRIHNALVGTYPAGQWNTVRIPLSYFNQVESSSYKSHMFQNAQDWYNALNNVNPLVNFWSLGKNAESTVYVSEVRLCEGKRDETLGNKFTHVSTDTLSTPNNSVTFENVEFQGKNVVKVTRKGGAWIEINIKPGMTISELYQYEKFIVKLYVDGATPVQFYTQNRIYTDSNVNYFYGNKNGADAGYTYPVKQWVDVEIPVEYLIKYYGLLAGTSNGLGTILVERGKLATTEAIYIHEIVGIKRMTGVALTDEVLREGEVTLNYTNTNNIEGITLSVKDANGQAVELTNNAFTATAGEYTVTFSADGYTTVTEQFIVYPEFNATIADPTVDGLTVTTGVITLTDPATGGALEGATVTVTAKYDGQVVSVTDGKFTAPYYGESYEVTYTVSYNGREFTFKKNGEIARPAAKADEVLSFVAPCDLAKVAMGLNNITYTKEWLAEFEGETGVVKFDFNGLNWPYMGFGTVQDMSAYADYDYLAITVYAPSAGNSLMYLKLGAETEKDTWPIGYESTIEKDKWHTYIFDITLFKKYWKPNLADFNWNSNYKLWFRSTNESGTAQAGSFYVSDISVIKGAHKAGITIKTDGTLREGEVFSVSYENPNNATNVTMTVKDPAGNVVADPSAITAVTGVYTVEYVADGYGTSTKKLYVVAKTNAPLYDSYTELNTATVTATGSTVTQATFDGKNVLKITKNSDTWVNVSVKPGKTIDELKQYENLVFRMYIEQSSDPNGVEFYTQTGGGVYFYGGTDGVADGNYFETGKWIEVVIPMARVIANYDLYYNGSEILIDRKDITAGTSFYISEIVCTPARYASVNVTAPVNGSVTADSYVKIGEQSTLTVTANTGYALASLTVDGVDVTAQVVDGKYTFTATADVNVVATFAPVDVTVTATGENVTVTGAGSYKYGEEVTLTFTPSENYKIDSVMVNGTEVTLTDGKYTFTAGLTNEVVVTTSLSIIREDLTATPIDVNLGNGQATYVITHADIEGTITAVYNNGENVTAYVSAIEGNKLTFAKEVLLTLGYGEKTFEVYTATHIYTVKVVLITKVITTAEELLNLKAYSPNVKEWTWNMWEGATTSYSYDGYFVLGNNIELGNTAVAFPVEGNSRVWVEDESKHNPAGAEEYSEAGFHGTFDGRGYTINGGIYGVGGLFGNVWKTGVIKNVALENVTLTADYRSAVIGISYFGTMDNVYIHVTENKHAVNDREYALLATNSGSTARMNNVFVYDETPKAVYPEGYDPKNTKFSSFINHMSGNPGAGAFTNVYVFTNNNVGYISSTQNHEVSYLDCGVVKKAVTDTLEGIDTSSFNAYWDFKGNRATFKSRPCYTLASREIVLSTGNDLVIDVTSLAIDGEFESLAIDGVTYDATYSSGKLTAKNADIKNVYGNLTVTATFKKDTITTTVIAPVLFITKVITTAEEVVNLLDYGINKENVVYNAGWGDDVNAVKYHGYFVLGNSIDLTGIVVKNGAVTSANLTAEARPFKNDDASNYSGFNGTFDGRGYTLYGGTYAQNGLFGNVAKGSVIKNVAIVDATVDGRFGAIMGVGFRGTLENVLIDVINIANSDGQAACRGVVSSVENTTTYKNVIIYVNDTVAGNDGGFYSVSYSWNGEASTVGSNSYIFTNYNTTENTPHTAFTINSANATLAEAGVDVSKFDSTIWDLTGDKAKFAKQLQIIEIPESQKVDVDVKNATFSVNVSALGLDDVSAIEVGGKTIRSFTYEGGVITATTADINGYVWGNVTAIIYAGNVIVRAPVFVYRSISTAEELIAIQSYDKNKTAWTWHIWSGEATEYNYGGYFVLTNNIDLGATVVSNVGTATKYDCSEGYCGTNNGGYPRVWLTSKQANNEKEYSEAGFSGVFDGRGYAINGGVYKDGGLFGYLWKTGVVKNVAFTNVTMGDGQYPSIIGTSVWGTIENSLFHVIDDGTRTGEAGLIAGNASMTLTMKNVILYDDIPTASMTGSESSFINCATGGFGAHTNVYVFTDNSLAKPSTTNSDSFITAGVKKFARTETLANVGVNTSAFGEYWDMTGDRAMFKSFRIVDAGEVILDSSKGTDAVVTVNANGSFVGATYKNAKIDVTVEGNTVTIPGDGLKFGENAVLLRYDVTNDGVVTESTSVTVTVTKVNKIITTADEFVNMSSYLTLASGTAGVAGSTYDGYLMLAADIDLAGKNVGFGGYNAGWYNKFMGTFDGRNHAIYNLTENDGNGGIFSCGGATAVFKNVRFYNASVGGMTSIVATNWDGLIENVFISGKITGGGAAWAVTSLLVTKGSAATIKNCAAVLEDNKLTVTQDAEGNYTTYSGIVFGEGTSSVKFENVITVQLAGTKTANYNIGRVPMGREDYASHESNTVKAFDSAEAYVTWLAGEGATAEWATTVKGYISDYVGTKIQPTATTNVITAGNTVSVACAQPSWVANWAISPAVAGVSISNAGVVTVANTVSAGTTFDVVTTGVDGTTRSMNFIVCEFVNLTAATQYIDLSNNETNTVINLTDKVEGEFVSAKVAGNTAVANASGAVVTIGADQFAFGNNTVVLRFEKKSGDVVIKVTEVTVTVKKADLVISDVESFNKINAIYTAKVGATVFVKNDFTYTGTYPHPAVKMNGYFYGDGHVITNLTVNNSIFGVTGTYGGDNYAVIRDIAFVNATVTVSGLALISDSAGGNFYNIYVSLSNKCATGVFAISKNSGGSKRMHDIFVDLTATPTAYVMNELHENLGPTLNGVYAIGGGSKINGKAGSASKESPVTDVGAAYANRAAMKTATNWQAEFATWDKNFWTTDSDGLPIAKSVKETIKLTTTTEVELNNAEKKTTSITVSGVENLGTVTYASIGGKNIDGVTAKNNVITVDATKIPVTVWGNCELSVYTTDYYVSVPVLVITKMIRTADDLDQMKALSKATSVYDSRWDGYFALANDIEYNKTFACLINGYAEINACKDKLGGDNMTDARYHGFHGVLDGRGYAIDGLSVQYWSGGMFLIFGGTIKDIAFTNVTLPGNTGLFAYNHGGTIKNVYVQVKEVKANSDTASYTILGSGGYGQVKVIDCFVDVPQNTVSNFYGIGMSHLGYGCVQGVYVVGNTNPIGAISTKENGTADIYNGYADRNAMKTATDWQAEFSTWDKNFWTTDADGLPIAKSVKNA